MSTKNHLSDAFNRCHIDSNIQMTLSLYDNGHLSVYDESDLIEILLDLSGADENLLLEFITKRGDDLGIDYSDAIKHLKDEYSATKNIINW